MFQAQFAQLLQSLAALIQTLQTWIEHAGGVLPDPVTTPDPTIPPAEPVHAPAEVNGWTVVAGTHGDDQLQGHAGVADLFLVTAGSDTIEGFEVGVDRVWVRDPATVQGNPFASIITQEQEGDTIRLGTQATWLDGPDGQHTGVAVALDSGALEVHGLTQLGGDDWVFGAEVPPVEAIEQAAPENLADWAFA
jgi:hypothetical protein